MLEVLIAFTIAALALGVLYKVATDSLIAIHTAGRYAEAVSRAQSHLAALGRSVAIDPGRYSGDDGDGYHWDLAISALANTTRIAAPPGINPPQSPPMTLYAVEISLSWSNAGRRRLVTLDSQRLAPIPQ